MASKSAKNGFALEAGDRERGAGEHPMYNWHWFEKANLEYARPSSIRRCGGPRCVPGKRRWGMTGLALNREAGID
jgi:hypothetical protein